MHIIAALLLAVLMGPERPIAPPSFGPGYGTQYPYELVTDGTDFVNIWSGYDGIYAAVVQEDGTPRTAAPRPLFRGFNVRAAWAGDAYVLVWQDGPGVWSARLSRDAQMLSTPKQIGDNAGVLALATQSGKTLVLLSRTDGTTATLLGSNGEVLRERIALSQPAAKAYCATAAATPHGFVVAMVETTWTSTPHSVATVLRFTLDGDVAASQALTTIPQNVNSIDSYANGERAGIAFVGRRGAGQGLQYLYTFTVQADPLAVTAHAPRTVEGDDPQVVTTPDGFAAGMLEYVMNVPLKLTTIAFGSDARTTTPLGTTTPATDLRMATNGRRVLSVWRDSRFSLPQEYSTANIFGIAYDATALLPQTDVVPVTSSAIAQGPIAIGGAGSSALVVWMDRTMTARGNVMARRLDANGIPLDPKPLSIAADVPVFQESVVVFTGQLWIVAWTVIVNADGGRHAYMRRVALDGTVLDTTPVDLQAGDIAGAASNGTVTLVAFARSLVKLSRAGERLETIALPQQVAWPRAIGSNGTDFLVVWEEGTDWWQFPSPNMIDVRAMRFDASGHPLDGAPIDVATSVANEKNPVIASDGTDFLVAYDHELTAPAIHAKRVLRTGVLADATATDEGSVVGTGEDRYAVAPREGGGYIALFAHALHSEAVAVHAVPLDARGVPAEDATVLATMRWFNGLPPYVAVWSNVAAYTRSDANLGDIARVYVRAIGGEPGRRRLIRR